MSAASYDIKIDQGSDFSMTLTFKDASGNLLNLTGFIFNGQLRANFSSPSIIASFTFDILDQNNPLTLGQVVVEMSAATSTAIPVPGIVGNSTLRPISKFIYDIEATFAGITKRWLQGAVSLSPEVTRV